MTTDAAGKPALPTAAGKAGRAQNLGRWLTRWWSQAPDYRTYQRRRADTLIAVAGLGVVIGCGVLVANRLVAGTDVAVFRRVNHWPGWLYPPVWTVQLSGVIGALPLVAAAAALLRRLRLAAARRLRRCRRARRAAGRKWSWRRTGPGGRRTAGSFRATAPAPGLAFPSGPPWSASR